MFRGQEYFTKDTDDTVVSHTAGNETGLRLASRISACVYVGGVIRTASEIPSLDTHSTATAFPGIWWISDEKNSGKKVILQALLALSQVAFAEEVHNGATLLFHTKQDVLEVQHLIGQTPEGFFSPLDDPKCCA